MGILGVSQVLNLYQVLHQLKKYGINIKGSKCQLFKREVLYLGKLILIGDAVQIWKNIAVVQEKMYCSPKSVAELRRVLEFIEYFCWYIANLNKLAELLFELLKGPTKKQTKKPITKN